MFKFAPFSRLCKSIANSYANYDRFGFSMLGGFVGTAIGFGCGINEISDHYDQCFDSKRMYSDINPNDKSIETAIYKHCYFMTQSTLNLVLSTTIGGCTGWMIFVFPEMFAPSMIIYTYKWCKQNVQDIVKINAKNDARFSSKNID